MTNQVEVLFKSLAINFVGAILKPRKSLVKWEDDFHYFSRLDKDFGCHQEVTVTKTKKGMTPEEKSALTYQKSKKPTQEQISKQIGSSQPMVSRYLNQGGKK